MLTIGVVAGELALHAAKDRAADFGGEALLLGSLLRLALGSGLALGDELLEVLLLAPDESIGVWARHKTGNARETQGRSMV